MAVSGISQTTDSSYRLNSSTVTPVPAATTTSVDKADPASIASAVSLGDMSSIVSTLGQSYSSTQTSQTYNAAGLLNSMATAGQLTSAAPTVPAAGADIPSYEQDLTDFTVVSTLSSSSGSSGIYTPSGSLQDLPLYAVNNMANGNIINTLA
jgi:hypothetical protein